ncbi:MAG TPA: EAL domain-containing protein [Solirubrobacteraceae bacterium]|jgi:EAL domain-containing protein (putative c-di-GMP-specific phosphodiesterase class I)|nr:EAL domain-containing protein [Solirubrobacteraceae bacterium]
MGGAPEHLEELIRQTIDPLQLMQRVSDQIVATVEKAEGALVGLQIDDTQMRFVSGSGHLAAQVGNTMPMVGSLSGEAIRSGRTQLTEDTEADDRVHKQTTRAYGVGSAVCVPLGRVRAFGMLAVCSRRPGAFGPQDLELLSGLADFISTAVGAATELMEITARICGHRAQETAGGEADRANRFVASVLDPTGLERVATRERIEHALTRRRFEVVFQPIFDLQGGGVFGLEALARFAGKPYRAPDVWLAEAHEAGLGVELELALLRAATEHLPRLPRGAVLTLNAGPGVLASPAAVELLESIDAERVVVELTEHVAVEDYPALTDALAGLRAAGVRLAIDDAGSGFASLMHILSLAPDFIKLDRKLISGIDNDPARRSLAASLMRFGEESGATIIAEGVETGAELGVLEALGVRHAQGFYLGRPAPLAELSRARRRGTARVRRHAGSPAGGPLPRTAQGRA